MTDAAVTARSRDGRALRVVDWRAFSLFGLLVVIAVVFHLLSGGLFLTPRNLYNLVVQTSVVAILASGMTLVRLPVEVNSGIRQAWSAW